MKIVSMEPTPSPYSLKVNINETLADGIFENYTKKDVDTKLPTYAEKLFAIDGVKGLYRVTNFITVERDPKTDWEVIVPKIKEVFGAEGDEEDALFTRVMSASSDDAFGEVNVQIQMIRHIPTQVKLTKGDEEKRLALSERLMNAAMEAATASNSYLLERKWEEQSPRYGDIDEVGETIVQELDAAYSEKRLKLLLALAQNDHLDEQQIPHERVTVAMLDAEDWRERYRVLAQMPDPTAEDYPVLSKALTDPHVSVRRIATAYLGMIEKKSTLPYLYEALKDKSVTVKRTAGDCLSDLGFTEAIPEMLKTLTDKSRIVRWRAAMFLYEVGDETAIPALTEALEDPEFEVRMQVKMALERIESGQVGAGSIWKQMEEATKK